MIRTTLHPCMHRRILIGWLVSRRLREASGRFLRNSNDSERSGKTDMRGQRRRRGCTSHSAPPPIPPVHVGSFYRDRGYVGVGRNLWVGADGRAGGRTGGRAGGAELRRRGGRPAGRLAAPNRFMSKKTSLWPKINLWPGNHWVPAIEIVFGHKVVFRP